MSDSMLFLILLLGLLTTFKTDWATAEDKVKIAYCNEEYVDIQVNANNTVQCKGFEPNNTIIWKIEKEDGIRNPVASCNVSACTDLQPGPERFSAQRSSSQSQLFFHQYGCGNDSIRSVICTSQLSSEFERTGTCKINAINPAVLSDCFVQKDDVNGGVNGSCQFQHAVSCKRGFLCTWYQEQGNEVKTEIAGNITYSTASMGPNGTCHFAEPELDWDHTKYSYSITFYPGPTRHIVTVSTSGKNVLPTWAVGIIVAVVVVIAVIVVAVWWWKRKKKPAANARPARVESETGKDGLYFEEHINPMYETGEDQNSHSNTNPYTKTGNPHSTKPPSSALTTEGGDGYEVVSPRSPQNQNVSSGHSAAVARTSHAASHVYALPEYAKKGKSHEAKDAAAYAQPHKPKAGFKVKTGAKGSPRKNQGERLTADNGEYNTLNHTRRVERTNNRTGPVSEYSHIDQQFLKHQ